MKNIYRRFLLVGVGLTLFTQSCQDLDETLYSQTLAEDFFKTNEEYIASLGEAYSSFGGLGNHSGLWSIQELASDELVIATKGGDWYDGGVLIQLHQHQWTPDNGFFNNTWGFLYGGVSTCNRLIYQFSQLETATPEDEARQAAFIAELRAVRALYYYWLVDAFGNVPLVTDFLDTSAPSNATRQQVYDFVLSELNEIIDLLPTAKDASTYGRMTKWAALAIRMKLYLNAEVYTGTAQWQKAADDAETIINEGPFALEDVYADNFAIDNTKSTENIFVYPYDKVFAQGFNWPMMTFHYASQGVFQFTQQPWNGYATVEEFYNSYVDPVQNPGPQGNVWKGLAQAPETGTLDERLSNFVVGPQFNPDGTRATDPGFEGEGSAQPDPDGAPLTFTPRINQIHPNSWRQAGARIGKYEIEQGGTNNMSNDFVVFRLSDVILSLAEAKFRGATGGAAEALVLVNQVRERAGVSPYLVLTEDNLLAERGREMFAEMVRRQDLIRFGRFGGSWWEKSASSETYELFPIPKAQLDANSNLEQNPGYD